MKKMILLILLISATICRAEVNDSGWGRHRAAITGMLTSGDTWQLESGYHFMLCRYMGVGASIGLWEQIMSDGYPSGTGWHVDENSEKVHNLYLRPSLLFQSPVFLKIRDAGISVTAEPGIMMNIPYCSAGIDIVDGFQTVDYTTVSTTNGQWCGVDLRVGINVNVYRFNFSIGYLMSNFDILSMPRHLRYNGIRFSEFYPTKPFMQGAYAAVSASF